MFVFRRPLAPCLRMARVLIRGQAQEGIDVVLAHSRAPKRGGVLGRENQDPVVPADTPQNLVVGKPLTLQQDDVLRPEALVPVGASGDKPESRNRKNEFHVRLRLLSQ